MASAETGEKAIPPAALTDIAQSAESVPTKGDPVPIALEERLDALPGNAQVESHETQATTAEEPPFLAAAPAADPSGHDDDGPLNEAHGDHATYSGRNPARAHGFLLVFVLVALAGAAYWAFMNPAQPPSQRTITGGGSATAPESASSAPAAQAVAAENPKQSPTEDPVPSAGPQPSSGGSSPATERESIPPNAELGPSTAGSSESSATARDSRSLGANAMPPAAGQAPHREDAQAPSRAGAAESLGGGTAKITDARGNGDSGRMVTQGRSKEQAERDAAATQRLIARELSNSP